MAIKLTDKEIAALAKKMADKQARIDCAKKTDLAKAKMPEAKKLKAVLDSLPEALTSHMYSKRYSPGALSEREIATLLASKSEECCSKTDLDSLAAEVTLQAHDCTTMAQLCKKLGI